MATVKCLEEEFDCNMFELGLNLITSMHRNQIDFNYSFT